MSFTSTTSQTHDALVRALAGHSGQTFTTAEIKQLVASRAPELGKHLQFLQPTDHCDNHSVKGACRCAKTEEAPLSRVSDAVFRVR